MLLFLLAIGVAHADLAAPANVARRRLHGAADVGSGEDGHFEIRDHDAVSTVLSAMQQQFLSEPVSRAAGERDMVDSRLR